MSTRFVLNCFIVCVLSGSVLGLPDCNFDDRDHWCDWVQSLDDEYQWKARQYPTFTPGTGPQADHTTASGWYIYTDSRDAEAEGWATRLISPTVEGSVDIPTTVMTFWYSMWDEMGQSMGTLNIYTLHDDDRLTGPVWSRSGPKTKKGEWKQARISLYSAGPFKVVLEGVRGPGVASDIGIDDVSFTNAPLPTGCDFESRDQFGPLCGFYQEDESDDFDWTLNAGETPSLDTGPIADHTFENNTGHYLFLETTRADEEKTATLTSFEYYKDAGRCTLEFYFHAFGSNVGALRVWVQDQMTEIDLSGGQDQWQRGAVNLNDIVGRYTIKFTGIRGDGNLGDIAIDDIDISGQNCFGVDVCASNPCLNGAQCIPDEDEVICNCTMGWTGTYCQLSVDECYSSPCEEPLVCNDLYNGYECVCPGGWLGENCEQEITEAPPPPEPEEAFAPETVTMIITVCVIAGVVIILATSITAYCTKQPDKMNNKNDDVKLDPVGVDNAGKDDDYDDDEDDY